MLTLKIDREEADLEDVTSFLEGMIMDIADGSTAGSGWEILGMKKEEEDFSGATEGDR